MIVSRAWLQNYFDTPLPDTAALSDALTFHAFEIDGTTDDTLDVKVLPNRAADCLSHRGIAREISAILDIPAKPDVFRTPAPSFPKTDEISVEVEDARKAARYMAALVKGVKIGPSPAWLKEALEAVGQRSINNVVDATNYVMLDLGQPLHAFDASKLEAKEGRYSVSVRGARAAEEITILGGQKLALPLGALVITDGESQSVLGIAGVKGGAAAEITESTTDIILESANFDGTLVRRTAQHMKLWTEAGKRFQNRPSPEFASYALDAVIKIITEIAGGTLAGVRDFYPAPVESVQVPCSLGRINRMLGTEYSGTQVEAVFHRLGLAYKKASEDFTVDPPFERTDITIPQDLVEEVGRIMGYDTVPEVELPALDTPPDQARFRGIERMKDQLVEQGFVEVSTQSFAKKGDVRLANPLDVDRPYLRTTLEENLTDALAKAKQYAPLVLPPKAKPKLFEVGTVFPGVGEFVDFRMTETAWDGVPNHDNLTIAKMEDYGADYEPKKYELGAYRAFSIYPAITRDIAFWGPTGVLQDKVENIVRNEGGELVARVTEFDTFVKDDRVSYAYRIVFQSFDRTLTDEEVNGIMEKISTEFTAAGYEVR